MVEAALVIYQLESDVEFEWLFGYDYRDLPHRDWHVDRLFSFIMIRLFNPFQ